MSTEIKKPKSASQQIIDIYLENATANKLVPRNFVMPALSLRSKPALARNKLLRSCWPNDDKFAISLVCDLWNNDRPLFVSVFKRAQRQNDKRLKPLLQLMALTVAVDCRGKSLDQLEA